MGDLARIFRYLFTEPSGQTDGDAVTRALGGGLLVATGADHLDLYLTGYRSVPTIGWMFATQFTLAFVLGLALLVLLVARQTAVRKAIGHLSWQQVASGSGAVLSLGTLFAYLYSVEFGLFGYKEFRTAAGIFAAALEIAAFVILSRVACEGLPPGTPAGTIRAVATSVALTLVVVAEAAAVLPAAGSGQLAADPPGRVASLTQGTAGQGAQGAAVAVITIKDFGFQPADPVVEPGEVILVTNEDAVAHTLSSPPGTPGGFSTGVIGPGRSVRLRAPTRPGRYPFVCLVHQFMNGALTVSATH